MFITSRLAEARGHAKRVVIEDILFDFGFSFVLFSQHLVNNYLFY